MKALAGARAVELTVPARITRSKGLRTTSHRSGILSSSGHILTYPCTEAPDSRQRPTRSFHARSALVSQARTQYVQSQGSPVWLKAMPGPIGQGFATALDDLPAAISAWVEGLLSVGIGPTHSGSARRQQESRHPNGPAGGLTVFSLSPLSEGLQRS